jgi:hypothetical protein
VSNALDESQSSLDTLMLTSSPVLQKIIPMFVIDYCVGDRLEVRSPKRIAMESSTATPGRGQYAGHGVTVPVTIPVSVTRRSVRKRVIKTPYDPTNQSAFCSPLSATSPTLPKNTSKVPKPARCILSTDNIQELISEAAVCRFCRRKSLSFTVENVGIASIPSIRCLSCERDCVEALPETTNFTEPSSQRRLTDYAANVLFVLGFLSVGDGGREAQRLLGLLDLPNLTSMESKTFMRIEKEIAPVIIELAENVLRDNLIAEVEASPEDHPDGFDLEKWKKALLEGDDTNYPEKLYPMVRAGTDMGWQQRRGAQDSLSGHAFLFGAHTRLPLWWNIRQKGCRICSKHKDVESIPVHDCQINHDGSSKSMEPRAVVEMVTVMFDKFKCGIRYLITDDDSTMKANCRWSNEDYKKEYGDYPRVPDKEGRMKKDSGTEEEATSALLRDSSN